MTIDPRLIGIGAALIAVVLVIYMPVSKRRVNQTIVAVIIAILIFVAALTLLELDLALPVAAAISFVVIAGRILLGGFRSTIYHNITRYTRRDFWQRRVGQSILGGGRRSRRD